MPLCWIFKSYTQQPTFELLLLVKVQDHFGFGTNLLISGHALKIQSAPVFIDEGLVQVNMTTWTNQNKTKQWRYSVSEADSRWYRGLGLHQVTVGSRSHYNDKQWRGFSVEKRETNSTGTPEVSYWIRCVRDMNGVWTETWVNKAPETRHGLWDACCCAEGRACVLGLTASGKVSSALRPYHRSISSWRSGPTPDQHFEGDRETH